MAQRGAGRPDTQPRRRSVVDLLLDARARGPGADTRAVDITTTMTLRLPALLGLCALAGWPLQQATFSSRTDIVRIDVLVSQNRRPIAGLTRGDFEVFDQGVRQQIDFVSYEEMPLNVVMAMDMSGSMSAERLD